MVPGSAPFLARGLKSSPYRSVMEVIVVSAHSPTLPGKSEMRSVFGKSSSSDTSGAGDHLSGGAVPGLTRSAGAAGVFSANDVGKLGCVQAATAHNGNRPTRRRKFILLGFGITARTLAPDAAILRPPPSHR